MEPLSAEEIERARRAVESVRKLLALQFRVWPDARQTEAGRHVTARVVVGMTEAEYARWRRETDLVPRRRVSNHQSAAAWEYHQPRGVAIDWPRPSHPGRVQMVGRGLRPADPGPRKGKGICSGWADEEDYGPRYED